MLSQSPPNILEETQRDYAAVSGLKRFSLGLFGSRSLRTQEILLGSLYSLMTPAEHTWPKFVKISVIFNFIVSIQQYLLVFEVLKAAS